MMELPAGYTICAYMRLSQEDRDIFGRKLESCSIAAQRCMIRDFIRRQPEFARCKVIERFDDGLSGRYFESRPQFTDMIDLAKRGMINCIIVKDCSRFGRDYVELGDYLEQVFPVLKVRFIAINDGYDSWKMEGGLDIAFKNLIYDLYSRELSEKVRLVKRQMALEGKYSSTYAPYGYRKKPGDKHLLERNEETAPVVREIFEMRLAGMPAMEIARVMNARGVASPMEYQCSKGNKFGRKGDFDDYCWTVNAVYRLLEDEVYAGTVVSLKSSVDAGSGRQVMTAKEDWVRVEGMHEAIVTQEEFQKVQRSIASMKMERNGRRRVHYRCGYCKRRLNREKKRLFCKRGKYQGEECLCRGVKSVEQELDEFVLMELKQQLRRGLEQETLEEAARGCAALEECSEEVFRRELSCLKDAKLLLFEDLANRRIDREAFRRRKEELDLQIAGVEQRLEDAKVQMLLREKEGREEDSARSCLEADCMTEEMWELFVKEVFLFSEKKVEIVWNWEEP